MFLGDEVAAGRFFRLTVEGNRMTFEVVDISLIISSRNRALGLDSCLQAISNAALQARDLKLEFIFVDNGSTDATSEVVAKWSETAPIKTTLIFESRPGLSHARNTGIENAQGRILAFTDDDCEVSPDYFTTIAALFADDTAPVMRGGRIDLGDERDLPITIKTDTEHAVLNIYNHPGGFIHGCNMAFPKVLADKVGLFDVRFGAGATFRSGEDTDYIHRAFRAGFSVEYVPTLVVKHFHGRRSMDQVQRLFDGYSYGNGALYAKYMFVRDSNMRGMFRWDVRQALKEYFGGSNLDAALGLTYRNTVKQNFAGLWAYWRSGRAGQTS